MSSCETCTDATLTATAQNGTAPYTYRWMQLPDANASIKIKGASMFTNDPKSLFSAPNAAAPIEIGITATLNNAAPDTWYAVMVTDQLGCEGGKALTLERVSAGVAATPEWKLNGNSGLDANGVQQWLGTNDSTNMVMKTNGQEVLKLRADGVTELMGGLRIGVMANILEPCGPDNPSARLMMDGNGFVRAVIPCPPPPECSTPPVEPWSLPPDGNTENIALCNAYQNVGIGMVNPTHKLHVQGTGYFSQRVVIQESNPIPGIELQVGGTAHMDRVRINTTSGMAGLTVKAVGSSFDALMVQDVGGNTALKIENDGTVTVGPPLTQLGDEAALYFGDGNHYVKSVWGGGLRLGTLGAQDALIIEEQTGNVGIGTDQPTQKLDVKGKIRADEIRVCLSGCDYVFEGDYPLRTINELEQFVITNKHLPEIPPASEMESDEGYSVGSLSTGLLKKVEELTLYIIQLEKRISELEKK